MSSKILVIDQGRIEQEGTPLEIFDRPATHFVAQFVGETNYTSRRPWPRRTWPCGAPSASR